MEDNLNLLIRLGRAAEGARVSVQEQVFPFENPHLSPTLQSIAKKIQEIYQNSNLENNLQWLVENAERLGTSGEFQGNSDLIHTQIVSHVEILEQYATANDNLFFGADFNETTGFETSITTLSNAAAACIEILQNLESLNHLRTFASLALQRIENFFPQDLNYLKPALECIEKTAVISNTHINTPVGLSNKLAPHLETFKLCEDPHQFFKAGLLPVSQATSDCLTILEEDLAPENTEQIKSAQENLATFIFAQKSAQPYDQVFRLSP